MFCKLATCFQDAEKLDYIECLNLFHSLVIQRASGMYYVKCAILVILCSLEFPTCAQYLFCCVSSTSKLRLRGGVYSVQEALHGHNVYMHT